MSLYVLLYVPTFAIIIGLVIFWVSVSEPASRPQKPAHWPMAHWALAVVVALINIAYLTTASLGIPLVFSEADRTQSPTTMQPMPAPPQTSP